MDRRAHWDRVYTTTASDEVSWYQPEATLSLDLLRDVGSGSSCRIIDVGGGDSRLVDAVLAAGLGRMTVLDLSGAALARARARLGTKAADVTWLEADGTLVELPAAAFDVWHDRAAFHFLTVPEDRNRYAEAAAHAVRSGGGVLVATFAPDGPTRCSGLEVARYTPEELARELGNAFSLVRGFSDVHHTPAGHEQRFTVAVLRRI